MFACSLHFEVLSIIDLRYIEIHMNVVNIQNIYGIYMMNRFLLSSYLTV